MTPNLARHRVLIDACLRHGVPFFWKGTGALLIDGKGVQGVLRDVTSQGHKVLGYEGFELEGALVHPRLDLIYDAERRPDISNPCAVVAEWPEEVWVDVVLAQI